MQPAPASPAPAPAARYQRTIAASLARIWENVLDWEHLPWLHRGSFRGVRVLEESATGWLAWIETPGRKGANESLTRVTLERPRLRYLTRTAEGVGAGIEIWTHLEPAADRATRITVAFHVPEPDPERARQIGAMYVGLYQQLWNEDEEMMVRRQHLLDEGGGQLPRLAGESVLTPVPLGTVAALREKLPLTVRAYGRTIRVVDVAGVLLAHDAVCPHMGGPLEDVPVEDGCLTCPWHGYRYDLASGNETSGRPHRLGTVTVRVDAASGETFLVW